MRPRIHKPSKATFFFFRFSDLPLRTTLAQNHNKNATQSSLEQLMQQRSKCIITIVILVGTLLAAVDPPLPPSTTSRSLGPRSLLFSSQWWPWPWNNAIWDGGSTARSYLRGWMGWDLHNCTIYLRLHLLQLAKSSTGAVLRMMKIMMTKVKMMRMIACWEMLTRLHSFSLGADNSRISDKLSCVWGRRASSSRFPAKETMGLPGYLQSSTN